MYFSHVDLAANAVVDEVQVNDSDMDINLLGATFSANRFMVSSDRATVPSKVTFNGNGIVELLGVLNDGYALEVGWGGRDGTAEIVGVENFATHGIHLGGDDPVNILFSKGELFVDASVVRSSKEVVLSLLPGEEALLELQNSDLLMQVPGAGLPANRPQILAGVGELEDLIVAEGGEATLNAFNSNIWAENLFVGKGGNVDFPGTVALNDFSEVNIPNLTKIGELGDGTLHVREESVLRSTVLVLAEAGASVAHLYIDGTNSRVETNVLHVGEGGVAHIQVSDSALLASTQWVGAAPNTTVLGNNGAAVITVSGGSQFVSGDATVGVNADSLPWIVVEGQGSKWDSGKITHGNAQSAKLEAKNGGRITAAGKVLLGQLAGSSVNAIVRADSLFSSDEEFIVGGEGTATVHVAAGGVGSPGIVSGADLVSLRSGTTVIGGGTVGSEVRVESLSNEVTVSPGEYAGAVDTLTVDAPLFESSGGMTLAIDAPGVGFNDHLYVTGSAALGGRVTASVGFDPEPWLADGTAGDWIWVLSADGALNGEIDGSDLPPVELFDLPDPAEGHHFEWRVVHDRDDYSPDPVLDVLGASPGDQAWLLNGTKDVVLVIAEIPDPVAVADSGLTPEDEDYSTGPDDGVLANDVYHGNDPLEAELVDDADHGSLTLNPDGSWSYTPDTGWTGTDVFTYRAVAGEWESDEQTVTITVAPVSAGLVAVDDEYHDSNLREIMAANPGIMSNDTGGGGMGHETYLVSGPAHGTLVLQADGGFDYVPDEGFWGDDQFAYRVFDGTSFSNVATVTLTIDDPLVMTMDDQYMTMAGVPLSEGAPGVRGNDMWVTTAQYVTGSGPSAGTLDFNSDGSFTYTPPAEYSGLVTFQYIGIHGPTGAQHGPATVTIEVMDILTLDHPPATTDAPALRDEQLAALLAAAARRWQRAGVSEEALTASLAGVRLTIADLPGSILGGAIDGHIAVDLNGAGHGWFIDATPLDDREFARQTFGSERVALPGSPAYGHVDLLTVLEHEIGHLLGLDHTGAPGNLMQDTLGLSTRRWATAVDAAIAQWLYESGQRERGQ